MKFKKLSAKSEKRLLISMLVILGAASTSAVFLPGFMDLSGLRRADLLITSASAFAGLTFVAMREYKKSRK